MQTVLTKHFQATGVGVNNKAWVRNDFRDEQGNKFSTFDAALASKTLTLLNQPIEVVGAEAKNPAYPNSYDFTEVIAINGNGQTALVETPGFVVGAATPLSGTTTEVDRISFVPGPTALFVKPVDRNAGLARAIESFIADGEPILTQLKQLQELADLYASYGALGTPLVATPPYEEGPTV